MEQIVYTLNRSEEPLYANFWTRVGAALLDALILAPVTWGLVYYNLIYIKSLVLSLILSFAVLIYKCFMEKKYGYTLGKKIMKISVVSNNFEALTYKEVLSRNYYYFLSVIIAFVGYIFLYTMPDFQVATTFTEVWELRENKPRATLGVLLILDNLWMLKSDKNQTLHDRLGKTLVIKRNSL